MELLKKAFGVYATNCYILKTNIGDFIIDPGVGSAEWVLENAKNPIAILNTHGHFDHIWCNAELKKTLNVPIFCPKEDCFMLESDCFNLGLTPQNADRKVENNEIFYFDKNGLVETDSPDLAESGAKSRGDSGESSLESRVESRGDSSVESAKKAESAESKAESNPQIKVEYMFFPGHTPGCSMIKIGDFIFSGDFIFLNSIGRSDFPYSSDEAMQESLRQFGKIPYDLPLYPGHGDKTSIKAEQGNLRFWLK
ncbi:hypothetical protein CCY99_06110 [Helicobacter sp. 16-1353]|uniref:MBL fold metallo-hydrolase n=1 Tax=Helicobacter sp. 16-1353 TaxID=2004996 RepID=UPI000DCC6E34|nr:MBL fold metallo-hydrolase [Helicobacter sp. 16-1353]RAX53164.1 hypothetical protein CCY99_06110 [Helicobacter sp. 16-1353]